MTISAFLEKTKHLCGKKQFYAKDVYFKTKSWSFVKKKKSQNVEYVQIYREKGQVCWPSG